MARTFKFGNDGMENMNGKDTKAGVAVISGDNVTMHAAPVTEVSISPNEPAPDLMM